MLGTLTNFLAPLITTFSVVTFSGAAAAAAVAALVPIPFVRRWATVAAVACLLVYFVGIYNYNLGADTVRAEWQAQNEMVAIAYAERDAENFLKTQALADALDEHIARDRATRKQAKDALRENLGPGNSRFTRDDIVRMREHERDTAPRR
jgi:hypothetical protein